MPQRRWHVLRGLAAVVVASGLFAIPVAAGVAKSGIDAAGVMLAAAFYSVYVLLVYWLFGRPLT